MPPKLEEEFELVLGNKQLLSLFFLAVVLFAVFFSFGYMVGFGRGQHDRVAAIASAEPVEESPEAVRLPDALLEEAPAPPEPRADMEAMTATARPTSVSSQPERKPRAVPEAIKPVIKQEKSEAPARTAPAKTAVSGSNIAQSIHLQIAAVRVREDAQLLVDKLQAKGYRVSLYDNPNDEWFRVVVGPFSDEEAAKTDQARLKADGLDSLLRRR